MIDQLRLKSGCVATAGLLFLAGSLSAQDLDISQRPLFLIAPVKPALVMGIDDSGSMDGEVIFPSNDGALWWHTGDESFTGRGVSEDGSSDTIEPGRINFNASGGANGTWKKYVYLFPNGADGGGGHRRMYADWTHDHFAIPPLPEYAYSRSPAYNSIYFDPSEEYIPFPEEGSDTFGDANPESAYYDRARGNSTVDLTEPVRSDNDNWVFRMYEGMTLPAGTTVKRADNNTCDPIDNGYYNSWRTLSSDVEITENNCSVAIEYFPATFWLPEGELPADFGYTGDVLSGGQGPDGETLLGYEIRPGNFASSEDYNNAIGQFANWFQYYRKRSLLTRAALGRSFSEVEFLRTGYFHINNRSNVNMRDMESGPDRTAFFDWQYDLRGSGGTPNKESVHHMGNQFRRTGDDAPILQSCQRNFGMLVTDGFSNQWTGAGVGNADGGEPDPIGDSVSETMADIAYYHYDDNLRPDLEEGRVPVPSQCTLADPPLHLDCNSDPHMNLFAITLGAKGLIFGVDENATDDPWSNPPDWPTAFPARHPNAVDDLWHATLGSRGEMFSATRPRELVEALSAVLREIASRILPVGVSSTSTRLDTDSNIFQGSLDSTAWSGDLEARNARSGALVWSAEDNLPDPEDRKIRTWHDGSSVAFDTGMSQDLRDRIFGVGHDAAAAERIIRYLRGERSGLEEQFGGELRDRDGRIGDIVGSRPVFTGPANEGWARLPEAEGGGVSGPGSYGAYIDGTKSDRTPMVLVGANDGMLHVFDADSGEELFAYVPAAVHHKLAELADPTYDHNFYVDGQITVRDAWLGGWRTVAVVTLGAGGRGVIALDITDPDDIRVMWEFNSGQDADLGYTFGKPVVSRAGDRWVTAFGNGYNSEDNQARLFVLDLETGSVRDSVALGDAGSNGLSGVAGLLDPATRTRLARVYGGDLDGTIWRLDFDESGDVSVAYSDGLFTDPSNRPVTATPTLSGNPSGGLMVFYGSGKLIEPDDRGPGSFETERFWAVRDQGDPITNTAEFSEASMSDSADGRVIEGASPGGDGWFLELTTGSDTGERVLGRATVSFGRLIFSTFTPEADPCATGGKNRVYVLNALTGDGQLPSCVGCAVIDLGEGAPSEPSVFIDPAEDTDGDAPEPLPPGWFDPDDPDAPEPPDPDEEGAREDWCSDQVVLNPETGELIVIGTICDGRQVWRQVR